VATWRSAFEARCATAAIAIVHLEERDRDAVRWIVDAADPWRLSNGVLVPVSDHGDS
jgi:hypothetical protein